MTKRLAAILLIAALMFTLCACGKDVEETPPPAPELDFPAYTRQNLETPGQGLGVYRGFMAGDSAIVLAEDEQRSSQIMRMNCTDFSYTTIEGLPFNEFSTADGRADGSALICGYDENGALTAAEIGADSSVSLSPILLPEELGDVFCGDLKALDNGYAFSCYIGKGQALCCVDRQGKLLGKTEYPEGSVVRLSRLADDSLVVTCAQGYETIVQLLNEDMSVDREYSIPALLHGFVGGCPAENLLAILDNNQICSVELEAGTLRGFANPGSIGYNPNILLIDDEHFIGLKNGEPILFTRGSGVGPITLRLSSNLAEENPYGYHLMSAVTAFNAANDKYLVEVVDYSAYGDQAQEQLQTDIVAGNTPDIYDVNCLPPSVSWSGGLFEELSPYFSSDVGISYDDILPGVRSQLERDGKVYEVCPEFQMFTMFAPADLPLEGRMTPEALTQLAQELGPERLFGRSMTRHDFLEMLLAYSGDDYLDIKNGACHFDDESFASLLEFALCLPEEPSEFGNIQLEYVCAGESLLYPLNISGLDDIRMVDACYGGNYKNAGFLSKTGSGVAMFGTVRLAMSANSEYKEGVWEFFRYILGEDYQRSVQTNPVNYTALERRLGSEIGAALNQSLGVFSVDGSAGLYSVPIPDPTEAHKALALELASSIDALYQLDPALLDMVENEAARFFAGAISADEAAENIQSRASIYLAEQYG